LLPQGAAEEMLSTSVLQTVTKTQEACKHAADMYALPGGT